MTSEPDKVQDKEGQNQQCNGMNKIRGKMSPGIVIGLEVNRCGETMVLSRWSYERGFRTVLGLRLKWHMSAKLHSCHWPSQDLS